MWGRPPAAAGGSLLKSSASFGKGGIRLARNLLVKVGEDVLRLAVLVVRAAVSRAAGRRTGGRWRLS